MSSSDEAYGPEGDAARHLSRAELDAGLTRLTSPRETGRVALIVSRRADGVRETPEHIVLSRAHGVPGDRWDRRSPDKPNAQLAVMELQVAQLITNGQALTIPGDNLIVDLDLSAANLPVGSRLRVGQAIVEVTPKEHNGCLKFKGRFGDDALRFVADKATRHRNLRGVYWTTIEDGEVRVGDPIEVISRATPAVSQTL